MDDVWDRVIDVDLKAVWRGIKLAAPHIAERGGGSIISTASVAAILGFPGLGAYGAAKAGVTALTRVAAIELASKHIRVNCILPGGIVTRHCAGGSFARLRHQASRTGPRRARHRRSTTGCARPI